ncbi:hypothetical protein [Herpetosiphon llansteffanensis]|uniref:hypothetical protein n=1 Tax=Herpetosiphon llansteffanensis TaxID=2094568 RepID=UPI000D7C3128|nr:hypothetical protein [Herpetosiphon llansteffanensis]
MRLSRCPSCQSDNIIPNATLHEMNSPYARLMVTVYSKPDALLLKKPVDTWAKCAVCGNCGYLMLYAENPQVLWEAYQTQKNS